MTTKAERIFNSTFYGAIHHIEVWGIESPFDAWNRLYSNYNDDEYICRRTVNAVLKECDKREKDLNRLIKYGCELNHTEEVQRKALKVVRNTCDNWIKNDEELKAM